MPLPDNLHAGEAAGLDAGALPPWPLARSFEASCIADPFGHVLFWSAGATRLLGHREPDMRGRLLSLVLPDLLKPGRWLAFHSRLRAVRLGWQAASPRPSIAVTRTGEYRPIELAVLALRRPGPPMRGFAAYFRACRTDGGAADAADMKRVTR